MVEKLAIDGGPKACDVAFLSWPMWGAAERKNLNKVLESGQWWYGERVREFEEKFAAFQDAGFGVTASSGSTALEVALLALGIRSGDEVILPPYTFMASVSSVLRVNAVPVFADIQPRTLCIDPADVERKITRRTKVIMPVHLAGYVSDMDRLKRIARKHKLSILEDACHSWGSRWKGKGTGALGDLGVFSFQVSKNIAGAEGGIILSDNERLAETCRSYTNCGRLKDAAWYQHDILGTNVRLTEFQAAILLAQLTRLERQTLKRQENAKMLDKSLAGIPGLITVKPDPRMTRRSYHFYVLRIKPKVVGMSRERFVEALQAEGVPSGVGYTEPLYKMGFFARKRGRNPAIVPFAAQDVDYTNVFCPVCEQVCSDTVWLMHPALLAPKSAVRKIIAAVRKVCRLGGKET